MTTALTILGGLALLVLGQIIIRSFIDPIYELRKLRGEIADALIYHANTCLTPDFLNPDGGFTTDARKEASHAFRSLGSQLEAKSYATPFYWIFALANHPRPSTSPRTAHLWLWDGQAGGSICFGRAPKIC